MSAPGSRPASQSTWKPLQMPSTGMPSLRPRDDVLHQGRAGRDGAGAQVVAVGEAAGEDDGVDVLEVVVGVPERDGFTPGQAHRAGGVDVVQGAREGENTDAHERVRFSRSERCSSTSSMTGLASSVSAICFSSASSGVPSTSSTKCLPWRTLRDAVVAEAPECAQDRLPLGVGDLRLEDHVDDHPGHADEGTWSCPFALSGEICTTRGHRAADSHDDRRPHRPRARRTSATTSSGRPRTSAPAEAEDRPAGRRRARSAVGGR